MSPFVDTEGETETHSRKFTVLGRGQGWNRKSNQEEEDMPSAMPRLLTILFAGLAVSLVGQPTFSQPTAKQAKKTAAPKPFVVTVRRVVSEIPKPHIQTVHPQTFHAVASSAVKPMRFSMLTEPTYTPMDAWAYAYKSGNGNAVHQAMAMNSPVIERLARGTRIQVIGRAADRAGRLFYEVQTLDSHTGWMDPSSLRF